MWETTDTPTTLQKHLRQKCQIFHFILRIAAFNVCVRVRTLVKTLNMFCSIFSAKRFVFYTALLNDDRVSAAS